MSENAAPTSPPAHEIILVRALEERQKCFDVVRIYFNWYNCLPLIDTAIPSLSQGTGVFPRRRNRPVS